MRPGTADTLAQMAQGWPFFANFLSNVAMTAAKADLAVADRYVQRLVPEPCSASPTTIRAEHELTVARAAARPWAPTPCWATSRAWPRP